MFKNINKQSSYNIYKITRRNIINILKKKNYYQVLGVNYDADYEEIKQSYYKLAKTYHPDINPSTEALEKFKEVKKAYEVIGDPNNRIAYDMENKFNDNDSIFRRNSDEKYTSKYGRRVMRGPRTIKNFYFDKWSDFKTPKWSGTKYGYDSKTEYILRDLDENLSVSSKEEKRFRFIIKYRIILYLLIIFSIDIYMFYSNRPLFNIYQMYKNTFFKH